MSNGGSLDSKAQEMWNNAIAARNLAKQELDARQQINILLKGISYTVHGTKQNPQDIIFRNLRGSMLHSLFEQAQSHWSEEALYEVLNEAMRAFEEVQNVACSAYYSSKEQNPLQAETEEQVRLRSVWEMAEVYLIENQFHRFQFSAKRGKQQIASRNLVETYRRSSVLLTSEMVSQDYEQMVRKRMNSIERYEGSVAAYTPVVQGLVMIASAKQVPEGMLVH
jgi:hypothetical protein